MTLYNRLSKNTEETLFSIDSIHHKYWKDFCDVCYPRFGFEEGDEERFRECH